MERITDLLRGCVTVEVTGAFPEGLVNRCANGGVVFWNAVPAGAYSLTMTVRARDMKRVRELAQRCQCTVKEGRSRGAPAALRRLRRRVGLVLGLALCIGLLFWSSLYIWEMDVYGNETVSDTEILNALEDEGVGIGSFWPAFTIDNIRSRVLLIVPELSWITVNVRGSRAEVLVRERIPKPEIVDEKAPADVVAEKSGILTEMRVLRGERVAQAGQTVLEGETLVSGIVSSSFAPPRPEHAMAEIYARTWYELTASAPLSQEEKVFTGSEKTRYALIFCGNRINFYRGSGILPVSCDKIIEESQMGLQDVFTLPVTLVKETLKPYETVTVRRNEDALRERLEAQLTERLTEEIGEEGTVAAKSFSHAESGGMLCVTLRAECSERIDSTRPLDITLLPEITPSDTKETN
jgi:similar to stage IV sporulation protein